MLWIPFLYTRIITPREAHFKATQLYGLLGLNCRPGSAGALYHLPLVKGKKARYRKRCGVDGVSRGNTSQSSFCLVSGLTLKNRRQSLGSKKDALCSRGNKPPGVSARV